MPPVATGTPQTEEGTGEGESSKGLTADDVNKIVHAAMSKRLAEADKKSVKQAEELLASIRTSVEEIVTSKLESVAPPSDGKGKQKEIHESPEVKGLQKQIADMQAQLKKSEEEKQAERSQARASTLRQKVTEALVQGGIDPKHTRAAAGLLLDTDKRVRFAEDSDELVFRDSDNTDVDFKTGISSWMKSDDAKIFQAPRGNTGSGTRPPAQGGTNQAQGPGLGELLAKLVTDG